MKNKIISLHGSYFGNNYGDILLVAIFAKWIKDICPNNIINLPLADKKKTKDLPEGTTGLLNLIKSEALVFCGGGYFGEQPVNRSKWARRNFWRHGIVGLLAIMFHIPFAIIGVEFGPISTVWFRKVCIFIARHAKVLVVRNIESKQFLESYGVENVKLSADAVLSLSDIVRQNGIKNTKEILLHIPGVNQNKDAFVELCKNITDYLSTTEKGYTIGLINDTFADIYHSDSYHEILEVLNNAAIPYKIYNYEGYRQLITQISAASFVVTSKLHVGITAAALNIRPLSFWLHPKSQRLHAQINNSLFCSSISNIHDFPDLIQRYFNQEDEYMLPSNVKGMALANKEMLSDFLKVTAQ